MMRSQRAQSVVEFALIAPLLFLLILFIVDFGRVVFSYNTAEFVALDVARYLTVKPFSATDAYINERCTALSPTCTVSSSVVKPAPNAAAITVTRTTCVIVSVDYTFQPISLMIANAIGGDGTIPLHAVSHMSVEPAQPGGC
jgi:Flp pilus assembly protein TadG